MIARAALRRNRCGGAWRMCHTPAPNTSSIGSFQPSEINQSHKSISKS